MKIKNFRDDDIIPPDDGKCLHKNCEIRSDCFIQPYATVFCTDCQKQVRFSKHMAIKVENKI
jgi:hypothetical protein